MAVFDRISVIQGDITKEAVDAIVNAANRSLLGGGGVDGAIHRAAGPRLLEECRTLNGCDTGGAKITDGYNLPADYVIHTVGPVWYGGNHDEDRLLASCYRMSLELASEHKLKSVAFPSISTGAYRFPFERASHIAVWETMAFLAEHDLPGHVRFVCFSRGDYETYREVLNKAKEGTKKG